MILEKGLKNMQRGIYNTDLKYNSVSHIASFYPT